MQSKCNPAREGESIMDDKLDEVIKKISCNSEIKTQDKRSCSFRHRQGHMHDKNICSR